MRLTIAVILLFCLPAIRLSATHIVGGEITYRCLGNNAYEITLTVYRDCYNGVPFFDDPASVGIYQKNADSVLVKKLLLPYSPLTNDTLPVTLSNPCLTLPPDVCVHKATYRTITTLPFNPDGYIIVYQRCCRNQLIRNLPDPLNTGISFVAEISAESQMECNAAAVFKHWPPVAICVHQPIDFDHSATDADGDSLVYRLCTPLNGPDSLRPAPSPPNAPPYPELIWEDPPYNLMNLLGGDPLHIDAQTGFLTGVPNTIGNFVVGVCVDEYRSGSLLSTTRRDFQYNVADCGEPHAAFFLPDIICDDLGVQFKNNSKNTQSWRWFFDWGKDPTQTSTDFSPLHTYPDTGVYTVALIAAPGLPCADTFYQTFHLLKTGAQLIATADPEEIHPGHSSQLNAVLPDALSFVWSPATGLSDPGIANPLATPDETTTYTVKSLLPNGCEKTASVTVRVVPLPCMEPYVFFPNAFSPNGDGENDVLQLEMASPPESVYWAIYDRWGMRIFETTDFHAAWDGTFQGKAQPAETYGFVLRVTCADGNNLFRKGNITLLR